MFVCTTSSPFKMMYYANHFLHKIMVWTIWNLAVSSSKVSTHVACDAVWNILYWNNYLDKIHKFNSSIDIQNNNNNITIPLWKQFQFWNGVKQSEKKLQIFVKNFIVFSLTSFSGKKKKVKISQLLLGCVWIVLISFGKK